MFGRCFQRCMKMRCMNMRCKNMHAHNYNRQPKENKTFIRKTYPCNVYPLKPRLYIVKLGYAGVYLFFLFLLQNIDCGYSLEPPQQGGSNVYPQSMF